MYMQIIDDYSIMIHPNDAPNNPIYIILYPMAQQLHLYPMVICWL